MFKQIRQLATSGMVSGFGVAKPPKYTLGSLRSFPSLEPKTFVPLPASFFDAPFRRDILWSAVVYEADGARVGSGYVPTKSDKLYSNRKLHPQKGTGRARVGDANSPIRDNEIKAHGIKAPHDWSTDLPRKIYNKAVKTAISDQYRKGNIFIVEDGVDFKYAHQDATKQFVEAHNLDKLHLLFITNEQRTNLLESTEYLGTKGDVIVKEAVQVRDLLKANRIYIEADALKWMIGKYM